MTSISQGGGPADHQDEQATAAEPTGDNAASAPAAGGDKPAADDAA